MWVKCMPTVINSISLKRCIDFAYTNSNFTNNDSIKHKLQFVLVRKTST